MMCTFSFWHWRCRCFGFQKQWFLSCFAISKGESEPNLNRIQACICSFTWLRGLLGRLDTLDSLGRTVWNHICNVGLRIQTVESFLLLVVFLTFVKKFFFINLHFLQLWKKLRPRIVLTASRTARTSRTKTDWFRLIWRCFRLTESALERDLPKLGLLFKTLLRYTMGRLGKSPCGNWDAWLDSQMPQRCKGVVKSSFIWKRNPA